MRANPAFARPIKSVDEQLATLVALQHDTAAQLASVRRQIAEAQSHELALVQTYGSREQRIDGLLDERLLAASATEGVKA